MIQSVARTYPLLNGYGRIANLAPVKKLIDRMTGEQVECVLSNGMSFSAPAADHVGRAAWLFGDLDPKLTRIAEMLLRKGDHVIDIGAHCGLFTLHAASLVGASGIVDAVEPQPVLAKMLKESTLRNELQQTRIFETALGSRAEVATLSIPSSNSGAASLIRRRHGDSRLPVVVQRSGTFFEKLTDGKIRFVKIDVEGYEAEVIRGALHFFSRHKADVVFFEAQHNREYTNNAAVSLLTECGYRCFPVLPSMRRVRLAGPDYSGSLDGVHDVLAVTDGLVGRDVLAALKAGGAVVV